MEHKLIIKKNNLFHNLNDGDYFVREVNNIVCQKCSAISYLILLQPPSLINNIEGDLEVYKVKPTKFEDNILYYDYI